MPPVARLPASPPRTCPSVPGPGRRDGAPRLLPSAPSHLTDSPHSPLLSSEDIEVSTAAQCPQPTFSSTPGPRARELSRPVPKTPALGNTLFPQEHPQSALAARRHPAARAQNPSVILGLSVPLRVQALLVPPPKYWPNPPASLHSQNRQPGTGHRRVLGAPWLPPSQLLARSHPFPRAAGRTLEAHRSERVLPFRTRLGAQAPAPSPCVLVEPEMSRILPRRRASARDKHLFFGFNSKMPSQGSSCTPHYRAQPEPPRPHTAGRHRS